MEYYSAIKGNKNEWIFKILCKWKKPDTKVHITIWFHLYEMSRIWESIKAESALMTSRCCGREEWGGTVSRHGVSFQGDENVLELDSVDGCIASQIYYKSLNYVYTLKEWILDYVDYISKEKQKQKEIASEVPGKCNKQSTPLSSGSASWACGLCSHQKGPMLDSMLCYHCFEILFF